MQEPRRPLIPPHAQRRNTRRPTVARVLVGLLVYLALGAGMWRTAAGAQCGRSMAAVVESNHAATVALETAHDHLPVPDDAAAVPGNGCSFPTAIVRADADTSPGSNDRTLPRTRLARLATATDPPALFRPPRSI